MASYCETENVFNYLYVAFLLYLINFPCKRLHFINKIENAQADHKQNVYSVTTTNKLQAHHYNTEYLYKDNDARGF